MTTPVQGQGSAFPAVSRQSIARIARALGEAPEAAYTTPIVYPWSLQQFASQPGRARPSVAGAPVRVYVHVPFCRYHCSFCFYAVRAGAGPEEKRRYVAALEREVESLAGATAISQLFVGGGTPTALPPELLSRVLDAVFGRVRPEPGRVHTIEASPDSVEPAHLDVLRAYGIGRISMGVESLDESILDTVHRRHGPADALRSCRLIVERGFDLNVDLIYGLPGQSPEAFRRDVAAATAAGVSSLSLYALRLNANTPVARAVGHGERFDLAHLVRWRSFVFATAAEFGFRRVRPYHFVREGAAALAPQSSGQALVGLGMSARSQIGATVFRNVDRSAEYVSRIERGESPVESLMELDDGDRRAQAVAGTLGNGAPLSRAAWRERFGSPPEAFFGERLQALVDGGLLEDRGADLALTGDGLLVYDRIVLGFYPAARQESLRSLASLRPRPPASGGRTGPEVQAR